MSIAANIKIAQLEERLKCLELIVAEMSVRLSSVSVEPKRGPGRPRKDSEAND